MARGTVAVNNLNLDQGDFPEIERKLFFIGVGKKANNHGKVLSLSSASDFDQLFGEDESPLKTHLEAASLNGGQNWFGWALSLEEGSTQADCLAAFDQQIHSYFKKSPEGVVVINPVHGSNEINAWHEALIQLRNETGRQMFALLSYSGVLATQTWADYTATAIDVTAGVAANRVGIVPELFGNLLGILAGRICNRSTSIADTPMRVETGSLLGLGEPPTDSEGVELPESVLIELDRNRFSTPQTYADIEGTYWADANMLEVEAGDYQVLEYLRPVLKACREVRTLAIKRIGDRKFNNTTESIAYHKTYFARPLRQMSKSSEIEVNGQKLVMVGDIMPPDDKAITINWPSKKKVQFFIKVKPYNGPKDIEANIVLDLSV